MYLGRFQLGSLLPLQVITKDGNGVATLPDEAPEIRVHNTSGVVTTARMPIKDRYRSTALFEGHVHLDSNYAVGYYFGIIRWNMSSSARQEVFTFEIVAGDANGAILNITSVNQPGARHLVWIDDTGQLRHGRNPT